MLVQSGDAQISTTDFDHNVAPASFGGGLHIAGSAGEDLSWLLDQVTFESNSALKGGGFSAASLIHSSQAHKVVPLPSSSSLLLSSLELSDTQSL